MNGPPFEALFRGHAGRVLATLIRLLGDFDLAEDARQDAYAAALLQWPREGVPANPSAWLIEVGRRRAIDQRRRLVRFDAGADPDTLAAAEVEQEEPDEAAFGDDRLRLIFTCCHPALATEAQVALTLRAVCGLTTAEVARAFLVAEETMAQRLVRAKKKIREAGIPYATPAPDRLDERLDGVLATMLSVVRADLLRRLGRYAEAGIAYGRALELTKLEPEHRLRRRRLAALLTSGDEGAVQRSARR